MQYYKNLSGQSNVAMYEIGDDFIKVQFNDGSVYLFNYSRPGRQEVEYLKKLAIQGTGLNSHITRVIKKNYASKLR